MLLKLGKNLKNYRAQKGKTNRKTQKGMKVILSVCWVFFSFDSKKEKKIKNLNESLIFKNPHSIQKTKIDPFLQQEKLT